VLLAASARLPLPGDRLRPPGDKLPDTGLCDARRARGSRLPMATAAEPIS